MENETKSPMASKTILTNSALAAIFPLLRAFDVDVTQDMQMALLSLIPLANILLRMVTRGGIKS